MAHLKDYLIPQPKSKIKAGEGMETGEYRFFTSSPVQSKYYHSAIYEGPALIFGTGGNASVHYCAEPFSTSTDCLVMYGSDSSILELIYQYLYTNLYILQAGFKGAGLQHISKDYILDIVVHLPDENEKNHILKEIRTIEALITARRQQLAKLDELVKSRFIELFGTVKNNPHGYPVVRIGECAKLQGGFAFKSSDYIDDGIRLVQISNVNKDTLDWDSVNYVPQAFLQKYKDFELHIGDLVLAMTRPVIKSLDAVKIATVSEYDVPSLLNQRVGRFVIDRAKLNVVYLMSCCQMTEFREYVETMSGNSLQPNISSKQVENYSIILPPMELQEQFASFVKQTDKSKSAIQQSLEQLETLKKALMQKYFG